MVQVEIIPVAPVTNKPVVQVDVPAARLSDELRELSYVPLQENGKEHYQIQLIRSLELIMSTLKKQLRDVATKKKTSYKFYLNRVENPGVINGTACRHLYEFWESIRSKPGDHDYTHRDIIRRLYEFVDNDNGVEIWYPDHPTKCVYDICCNQIKGGYPRHRAYYYDNTSVINLQLEIEISWDINTIRKRRFVRFVRHWREICRIKRIRKSLPGMRSTCRIIGRTRLLHDEIVVTAAARAV